MDVATVVLVGLLGVGVWIVQKRQGRALESTTQAWVQAGYRPVPGRAGVLYPPTGPDDVELEVMWFVVGKVSPRVGRLKPERRLYVVLRAAGITELDVWADDREVPVGGHTGDGPLDGRVRIEGAPERVAAFLEGWVREILVGLPQGLRLDANRDGVTFCVPVRGAPDLETTALAIKVVRRLLVVGTATTSPPTS